MKYVSYYEKENIVSLENIDKVEFFLDGNLIKMEFLKLDLESSNYKKYEKVDYISYNVTDVKTHIEMSSIYEKVKLAYQEFLKSSDKVFNIGNVIQASKKEDNTNENVIRVIKSKNKPHKRKSF